MSGTDEAIVEALEISDSFLVEVKDAKPALKQMHKRQKGTLRPTDQDITDDYNYARGTLHDLIEKGGQVLNDAILVAQESKHPRALEVAANILKQMSELSQDLLELSSKAAKIDSEKNSDPNAPKEQHNHIHVGTTEDLRKTIKELKSN